MADCVECRCGLEAGQLIINEQIRENGFAVIWVSDVFPNYAYSIGLGRTFGIPKFILMGNFGGELVNNIAASIHRLATTTPEVFRQGREISGIAEHPIGYIPVSTPREELPIAKLVKFYGNDPFDLNQIVIYDKEGRLPWYNGFDQEWCDRAGQVLLFN